MYIRNKCGKEKLKRIDLLYPMTTSLHHVNMRTYHCSYTSILVFHSHPSLPGGPPPGKSTNQSKSYSQPYSCSIVIRHVTLVTTWAPPQPRLTRSHVTPRPLQSPAMMTPSPSPDDITAPLYIPCPFSSSPTDKQSNSRTHRPAEEGNSSV